MTFHQPALPFCARTIVLCTVLALLGACSDETSSAIGSLELGLTTQANGITYRLNSARFTLEGPQTREFAAEGDDELTFELPAGAYRLTLLEGFQLVRVDAPDAPTQAKLISQNPAPVLITPGQTARVTLRFELPDGTSVDTGSGRLSVGIEIGAADGGAPRSDCALGLRINEIDYEQASSDEAEFVELINSGTCAAPLSEVVAELLNGSDGRAYGRYPLADVAPELAPGERLVLGDANVLAALPSEVKRAMLNGSGLQNGPDAIRLVLGDRVLDAVSYEGPVAMLEGAASVADDGALGLSRCPDTFDTNDATADFRLTTPTPGAPNQCGQPGSP